MANAPLKRQTLEQQRITAALDAHKAIAGGSDAGTFAAKIKGVPVMIRTNGLGVAVAMLAQNKGAEDMIADAIAKWILETCPFRTIAKVGPGRDAKALLNAIGAAQPGPYRLAQAEAMAYSQWIKRFAEAFSNAPADGANP